MQNNFLEAALDYAGRGISVIPIRPDIDPAEKKALKRPYIPWADFQKRRATPDEIRSWAAKYPRAMLGIVTGEISGILIIDCDTQEGYEAIQKLLPDALLLPVARTPRGGWHLWFIYPTGSKITVGTGILPGVDFRGEGGYAVAPPSVNGDGKGYTWQEGLSLNEVEPATVPEAIFNILNNSLYRGGEVTSEVTDLKRPQVTSSDLRILTEGRRDNDLFHAVNCLVKGGCEIPFIEQVSEILARNSRPPFPENEIRTKIDSALKRADKREINFADEVRDFVVTSNGLFMTSDVTNRLQVTSRQEKKNVVNALLRLHKEGIIERAGQKDGCYRRIDRSIEYMDFANADIENYIDLRLPLGLHAKTNIYPKGAIVIAGVSGMGKTLYALNTIADNMGRFPIFYFNSEMGPEALKKKLSHFPILITEWEKNMKVVDNWDFNNIADKVQPDGFNVIDYLEPEGEKAFNIHGVISAIIRRLNKGTALITIQKKPGATMGTGGVYSIKAATLALALDWGKLEIVKNRFREADPVPSLTKINFEVHQGYKFVKVGNWYK